MLELWLVDGYNLLHDLNPSRRGKKPAKEGLFDLLADFASASDGRRVVLVLDGKGDDCEHEVRNTRAFSAVYSQDVSADAYIEKKLFEHRANARLFVVTKDRAITLMARGGGASVLSPAAFMEWAAEAKKNVTERIQGDDVKTHGFHRPFDRKFKDRGL